MLTIDKELCIHCGTCVEECSFGCLKIEDEVVKYDDRRCITCGHCLAVCPKDAIMIDGDGYDVEEVQEFQFIESTPVALVRRDIMMRRSVRSFNDEPVEDSKLDLIVEAAKYAPTAKNCQKNALKVITDPDEADQLLVDLMEQIGEIGKEKMRDNPAIAAFFLEKYREFNEEKVDGLFYGAPVIILVFSHSDIDGAICAATMGQMIEATDLGFCYVLLAAEPMNTPQMRQKYNVPDDMHCVIAMAVGHYDAEYFCSVPRKDVPLL
ncbi:MAG: nitroreductase family protein [Lachnospiraceae bacterium]|nr:nitroreductase family protein [Lachnospiraceae bacterium]